MCLLASLPFWFSAWITTEFIAWTLTVLVSDLRQTYHVYENIMLTLSLAFGSFGLRDILKIGPLNFLFYFFSPISLSCFTFSAPPLKLNRPVVV